ncbi:MAG: hypothetical protein R3B70_43145 [Polyangiaceae bacterium]
MIRTLCAVSSALVALALSGAALADAPPSDAPPAEAESEEPIVLPGAKKPHRVQYVSLGLAFSTSLVESKGLDAYSDDDVLPMISVFGTVTPFATRPFSVHLAFGWDWGQTEALARGIPSSLDVHRLSLGIEGRYMPISRLALFVRALPAAIHAEGNVQDASFADHLSAGAWTWGVDLTGGAAARLAAFGNSENPAASVWMGLDMGYRFAGTAEMKLKPAGLTEDDLSRRFGELPMAALDLSGFTGRLHVSVWF